MMLEMMSRTPFRAVGRVLALGATLSFAGIDFANAAAAGKGEGEVSIIAWAGYVERGDSDKNYDWVTCRLTNG